MKNVEISVTRKNAKNGVLYTKYPYSLSQCECEMMTHFCKCVQLRAFLLYFCRTFLGLQGLRLRPHLPSGRGFNLQVTLTTPECCSMPILFYFHRAKTILVLNACFHTNLECLLKISVCVKTYLAELLTHSCSQNYNTSKRLVLKSVYSLRNHQKSLALDNLLCRFVVSSHL